MTTTETTAPTITATGGFNTGRLYTANGQRIWWAQRSDGWLFFTDRDRMVTGWIERQNGLASRPINPTWLMHRYDAGEYAFAPPVRVERDPTPPADFDYGDPLRI